MNITANIMEDYRVIFIFGIRYTFRAGQRLIRCRWGGDVGEYPQYNN